MANKIVSILSSGTNNFLNPTVSANRFATDILSTGIVGSLTNTLGVAPSTGGFAVNAQGSPNMTVAISAGALYVSATPSGGIAQTFGVTMDAAENFTIASNATGSTVYDFLYLKLDTTLLNNPDVAGTTVATFVTQRSTTQGVDSNGALANAILLAEVTVTNGAVSISNANILDRRQPVFMKISSIDGWRSANEYWAYASATTITVPTDATIKYAVGDRIRLVQSGAVKYFYVTAVAATVLTITAGTSYTLVNAEISQPFYSKEASPAGFPQNFTYTPTWGASGTAPSLGNGNLTGHFNMTGKMVYFWGSWVAGSTTTYGTNSYFFNLPIPSVSYSSAEDQMVIGSIHMTRQGVANVMGVTVLRTGVNTYFESWYAINVGSGTAANANITNANPYTWANTDLFGFNGNYPVA